MEKKKENAITAMHGVAQPKAGFKTTLYLPVSIAVLFIAIIPAKYISGMFSEDNTAIFCLSLIGSMTFLEFLA